MVLARVVVLACALALTGCSPEVERDSAVDVMATGLEVPWGLTFLPSGDALVGERPNGRLFEIPAAGGDAQQVGTVPDVVDDGEGGLLGLVVDPDHAGLVYAYLTSATDNRIVRFRLGDDPGGVEGLEVLLDGIAKAGNHDGGALAFGPDGMLYAGVGDAAVPDRAQDPDSLNGKILRMTADGDAPDDNPTPGSLVWSMGHRNVQGLAWDEDGRMYATEFGQDTFDEVNLIEPGNNYGWPMVEGEGDDPAYTNPLVTWSTDEASPSGAAMVDGGDPEPLLDQQFGRLRNVQRAPDGSLWITTSNRDGRGDPDDGDDRVLRLPDPDNVS